MITRGCERGGCTEITLGGSGSCWACGSNLCPTHSTDEDHPCLLLTEKERDIAALAREQLSFERLMQLVRTSNLLAVIKTLRLGDDPRLHFPDNHHDSLGNLNIHIPVEFDDETRWLVRIPHPKFNGPRKEMGNIIIASEVATIASLGAWGLAVPDVLGPITLSCSDGSCLQAMLVKELPGAACDATVSKGTLGPSALATVIDDLASFYIGMSSLSFRTVGSLTTDNTTGKVSVGPLISLPFRRTDPPFFFGPIASSHERYIAQLDWIIDLIDTGAMFRNSPLSSLLYYLEVRRVVDQRMDSEEGPTGPFYIKHADDRGDQILLDGEGHITGIIDWEWACTTSKEEAFAAPCSLIDVQAFFDGSNELCEAERIFAQALEDGGRSDLASCVRNGKFYQRLSMITGQAPDFDMLKAFVHAGTGEVIESKTMEDWVEVAKGRYADNEAVKRLLK